MDIREKIAKELYASLTGLNWPPIDDDGHKQAALKFADKILALPEIKEGLELSSSIPLITLQGMISSLAIENPDHAHALDKIDMLIDKFGPLKRINKDDILLLYI